MRALGVLMIVCLVVFARATAGAAEAGQGYGAWHWEAELDRMEDTQTVRVYTHALAPVTLRWDPVRPVLLVACFRDTTYVLVDVKTFLTHDRVAVAWRLDREPPIRGTYPLTRDGETFILAHGAAAIDMARNWYGRERVLVEVAPFDGQARQFEFDIRDLRANLGRLALACHWPGGLDGEGG